MLKDVDFSGWQHVRVHALLAGKRIDLRTLRNDSRAAMPLAIRAGAAGIAVLFRYGVVVMFNLQLIEEAAFVKSLQAVVDEPLANPETEETAISVDAAAEERVGADGIVYLRLLSVPRLLLLADVLAKSVILAFDESRVAQVFERIEPVAESLQKTGGRRLPARQLLEHIGDVLITQHRMVGRVEVTEKPELLWDRPELDRLYRHLQKEYELPERHRALNHKLELISQTATTALALLDVRRTLRLEWYVIGLIFIEIVLTLYQMAVGSH